MYTNTFTDMKSFSTLTTNIMEDTEEDVLVSTSVHNHKNLMADLNQSWLVKCTSLVDVCLVDINC